MFQIFENRLYEPNLIPAWGAIDVKAALKPILNVIYDFIRITSTEHVCANYSYQLSHTCNVSKMHKNNLNI